MNTVVFSIGWTGNSILKGREEKKKDHEGIFKNEGPGIRYYKSFPGWGGGG
jgi:hypothetical protein